MIVNHFLMDFIVIFGRIYEDAEVGFMAKHPFPGPLREKLRQMAEDSGIQYPGEYEIIYSARRTLSVEITLDGEVKVRAPRRTPKSRTEDFLIEKRAWILNHLAKAVQNKTPAPPPLPESERRRYMELARDLFTRKAAWYASIMHVSYGRISIREQKTRWGSCSSKGNLNFNWRLIFAPEAVLDYIVIHELAHRREMNHSQAFYRIVASVMPDYKEQQKWLRDHGQELWRVV